METSEETTASQHPLGATDSCTDPASSIYPIAGYYTLKDGTTISIWNEPGAKGDALGVVIKRGEKTLGGYFRLETSDSQSAWFLKDSKPAQLTGAGDGIHFYFEEGRLKVRNYFLGQAPLFAEVVKGEVIKIDVDSRDSCANLTCADAATAFPFKSTPCDSTMPVCLIPKDINCNCQVDSQNSYAPASRGSTADRFFSTTYQLCETALESFCESIQVPGVLCVPLPRSCQCLCDF